MGSRTRRTAKTTQEDKCRARQCFYLWCAGWVIRNRASKNRYVRYGLSGRKCGHRGQQVEEWCHQSFVAYHHTNISSRRGQRLVRPYLSNHSAKLNKSVCKKTLGGNRDSQIDPHTTHTHLAICISILNLFVHFYTPALSGMIN